MRFILVTLTAFAFALFLSAPNEVEAHSGGLNSQGCHAGSKPYHCHRSSSEMVGNRLRCDLGSRSKECDKRKTTPPSQENNEVGNSPSAVTATTTSGSVELRQSEIPTQFKDGIGLNCQGIFLLFNSSRKSVAKAYFQDDMVLYYNKNVSVYANKLTWSYHSLNRETLKLKRDSGNTYQCSVYSPNEIHRMAQEALKAKLGKNKL